MAITISGSGITSANIADGTIVNADINSSVELGVTDAEKVDLKSGRKNLIINGGFDVWQRGTSFSTTPGQFTADRWSAYTYTAAWGSSSTPVSQVEFTKGQTDVPGNPTYYLRMTGTSDGRYSYVKQQIEDVTQFSGVTCTLSFYAKSSSTFTSTGMVNQSFGSGGSSDVNTPTSSITTTTSWARYEKVITLPSISGKTVGSSSNLKVYIMDSEDLPSGVTLDIANVQLELGSVATDFEHRSYGEELALCQRYWQQSYEIGTQAGTVTSEGCYQNRTGTSTSGMYRHITLPVGMRTAPTITLYGTSSTTNTAGKWRGSNDAAISMSPSYSSHNSFNVSGNMNQSYTYLSGHWTADSEL
jgi:hypothetical protein